MSEETKELEKDDSRYVEICARIKTIGHEMRESIFQLIEENEVDEAIELVETLGKLDRIYMLSLKTGMEIVDRLKKEAEAAQAAEAPAPAMEATA